MTHQSPSPRRRRPAIGLLAAVIVLLGSATQAAVAEDAAAADEPALATAEPAATAGDDLLASIHYEDVLAHAGDAVSFAPGDRVTVPFQPRAGDRWPVAGRAPRALPAGQASGEAMAKSPQGSRWASDGASGEAAPPSAPAPAAEPAPIDIPAVDPSAVIDAAPASLVLPTADEPVAPAVSSLLRREVFGFLPYWELALSSTTLNYSLLSTIAYFGVGSDRDGNLLKQNVDGSPTPGWGGWTSDSLTTVINTAHGQGTRVVLTVQMFAWTPGQQTAQAALLGNPIARLNLARQAAAAIRDRGADGINLDFEPIVSGYGEEFAAFVREVRAELDALAPGYQLTFDTTGRIGNYPLEAATAPGGADAIFVMGYDYRGARTTYVGSISPLSGPLYDLTETVQAYTARVPASMLILGVPWYGRAWSTVSDAVNAQNQSGAKFGASATVVYETAADLAAQHGRRWDPVEQTPWFAYQRENCTPADGCVTSWREVYYDDPQSLGAKYDMVNLYGLRGAGIWALGYDGPRPELYHTIAAKFLDDTTAPLAGVLPLADRQMTETYVVSWAGRDDLSGVVSYDVQVSVAGGPWTEWLAGTTATSGTYLGANGHGVAFRARARDAHANASPWDVTTTFAPAGVSLAIGGFGRVTVDGLNFRAGAGTGAGVLGSVNAGTLVAITGGPVSDGGYNWYQVTLPILEWGPVSGVNVGVWIAASDTSQTFIVPAAPPNATLTQLPEGWAPAAGASYAPVPPTRLLDTRSGNGLAGAFRNRRQRVFQVGGVGPIPADAVAVTGNLTVVGQTSAGFVTLGPAVGPNPSTSTLNVPPGDTRANGVTVALGPGGTLSAVWAGKTGSRAHLLFDVTGYFTAAPGATYHPHDPTRLLDSRAGNGLAGPFRSRRPREFHVAGRASIPSDAVAVTGNLTVVGQTSAGFVTLGPSVGRAPKTSTLNVPRGDIRANGVTVALGAGGRLSAVWAGAAGSRAHLLLDVTGYFTLGAAGATYHPLDPTRLLDTRTGNGLADGFATASPRAFQVGGRGTIPSDAVALTGNLTVVGQASAGFVTLGPSVAGAPATSTLNVPRGDVRANGVIVPFAAYGVETAVWVGRGSAHLILDATGYFR